jgi:tetratricopeptide (TPR) repeat protein
MTETAPQQLLQHAHGLLQNGRDAEAEAIYQQLVQMDRADANLLSNLAVICWRREAYAAMEEWLRQALQLDPYHSDAHYNLALALSQRGASREAISHYRQALSRAQGQRVGSIHWNLSKLLLRTGDYTQGWVHYEWRRFKAQPLPPICPPGMPPWQGRERVRGELVLVGEQGLGDMIQFLRYAPLMQRWADQVALCLPEKLHALVAGSGLPVRLLSPTQAMAQRHGQWWPLLSAPGLLGVNPEQMQMAEPYLKVPAERLAHWRQLLRRDLAAGERLVGLHWQGNPATETNELRGRSLPLHAFAPLAKLAGLRFVSLQKGPGSEQLSSCSFRKQFVTSQAAVDATWNFVDTAAITLACDLVISSDSALAHLAGAVGAPTWLLLHQHSDWRWGETGMRSGWYRSLRLFRQQQVGDWAAVIATVAEALVGRDPSRRALELMRTGQRVEAEQLYRQQLNAGTPEASTLANLGALCAGSGRLAEATALFRQALELDPKEPSALRNLAEALWQQPSQRCNPELETVLLQLLRRNPNDTQSQKRLHLLTQS